MNTNSHITLTPIAHYEGLFGEKFGVPKQARLVKAIRGRIIFSKPFCDGDFLRGIDGFSHLWLLWGFSVNSHAPTSPLVRPPLLGGNSKVGVFASRSPFRPNPIGLSAVELCGIETNERRGSVLIVAGADLINGTPIYDIKPYIPLVDAIRDARGGFTDSTPISYLGVELSERLSASLSTEQAEALLGALSLDPRPHYHHSPDKVYGLSFAGRNISFRVCNGTVYADIGEGSSEHCVAD